VLALLGQSYHRRTDRWRHVQSCDPTWQALKLSNERMRNLSYHSGSDGYTTCRSSHLGKETRLLRLCGGWGNRGSWSGCRDIAGSSLRGGWVAWWRRGSRSSSRSCRCRRRGRSGSARHVCWMGKSFGETKRVKTKSKPSNDQSNYSIAIWSDKRCDWFTLTERWQNELSRTFTRLFDLPKLVFTVFN
jgi:hypothetical protein